MSDTREWLQSLASKENWGAIEALNEWDRLEAELTALRRMVVENGATCETEYAGRMETYCFYCDELLSDNQDAHAADCDYVKIKAALQERGE